MFGESDSESPRVPSPWDTLTSVPPTLTHNDIIRRGIPQLVPENEEGNVEYKLHLLSPSPSRFTRLVTQLKWRLLEGGGQAYYELGVADSGALIGLGRREMEETLSTLEEMAGEIGASVIVVKEIEVPAEVSEVVEGWGGDGGKRMRQRQLMNEDSETTATETELETTDADDDLATTSSHVEVFCMDNEEVDSSSDGAALTLDLEIATVYKPRPFRRRVASTIPGHSDRRKCKGKKPKHLLAHTRAQPSSHSEHHAHHLHHSNDYNHMVPAYVHSTELQAHSTTSKQSKRRAARDKRGEVKRDPYLMHVPTINSEEMSELVSGLESFHITLESEDLRMTFAPPEVGSSVYDDANIEDAQIVEACSGSPSSIFVETYHQRQSIVNELAPPPEIPLILSNSPTVETEAALLEPRLIVEALVVRKMLLEEAFLDFGGFSVC